MFRNFSFLMADDLCHIVCIFTHGVVHNIPLLYQYSPATLAENSRLNKSQGVVKAYMTIMSAYRGEVPCTVTTATVSNSVHVLTEI